jgi:Crinkler effector protein N-terminal domain
MVKLFCSILGEKGSAFAVEIEQNKSVDAVKDMIKKENMYEFASSKLQLYLGKASDVTWLESSSEDVQRLKEGGKTDLNEALMNTHNELQGAFGLQKVLKDMPVPSMEQIHLLVVVPVGTQSVHTLSLHGQELPQAYDIGFTEKWRIAFLNCQLSSLELPPLNQLAEYIKVAIYCRL